MNKCTTAGRIVSVLALCFLLGSAPGAGARENEWGHFETYLQYAPIALDASLALFGVPATADFLERGAAIGTSFVAGAVIVHGLKHHVYEMRPDGTDCGSFPSGHTCYAFTAAELIRSHYGWKWGTAAYASACLVGATRIARGRHYWWDVAAGAALGFATAKFGLGAAPLWKQLIDPNDNWRIASYFDPMSGAVCGYLCYRF